MRAVNVTADWAPRPTYVMNEWEKRDNRAINGNQVWKNPKWEVVDHPDPVISRPDEMLLRVKACGMCGSDVHMYETDAEGYILLAFRTKFPCVLGHEFSGEVVEIGADVTKFRVGEAVAVEQINYCGECRACRFGLYNQCDNPADIGFTVDGAYAEYIVVREKFTWSLEGLREIYDEDKVYEIGALTEPTGVAYEGMFSRAGGFRPGDHVAVFGAGPIGLAAVQLAVAAGAGKVIAFDTQPERRAIAEDCGADAVFDPVALHKAGTRPAEQVMEITKGEGVGLAVEAAGFGRATFPEIEDCIDFGGKVVVIGVDPNVAPIMFPKYLLKAGRIFGSLGHCGGDFGNVINLHRAGRIDMTKIVTQRYDLEDTPKAVERTSERIDAKVLVKP